METIRRWGYVLFWWAPTKYSTLAFLGKGECGVGSLSRSRVSPSFTPRVQGDTRHSVFPGTKGRVFVGDEDPTRRVQLPYRTRPVPLPLPPCSRTFRGTQYPESSVLVLPRPSVGSTGLLSVYRISLKSTPVSTLGPVFEFCVTIRLPKWSVR